MDSYCLYVFFDKEIRSISYFNITPCDVILAKNIEKAKCYFFYQHKYVERYNESQVAAGRDTRFEDLSEEEKKDVIEESIDNFSWNKIFCIPLSQFEGMKEFAKMYEDKIIRLEHQIQELSFIEAITDPKSKEMSIPFEMVDHIMKFT